MTARRVSCVVADDHPILLHAIQSVLEGHGIHVTGTATSGQGAIELIRSTSPTVALVDLRLEGADGIEVARILRRENVATRIILFTGIGNGRHLAEALALGVQGFIQKDAPVDELLRAIEMVCAGTPYIDPTMGREIAAQAAGQARVLTARESDVLRMVAAGQTTGGRGAPPRRLARRHRRLVPACAPSPPADRDGMMAPPRTGIATRRRSSSRRRRETSALGCQH
jgi:DNA-binding NarL/FixJ family response regulator